MYSRARDTILSWGVKVRRFLLRLWQDESGQDLTEYALLVVLVALAAVASLKTLANTINNVYRNAANNLATTTT
jgi:pilus assembly protein Flp/PilA